jgi:alpha-glucosidase
MVLLLTLRGTPTLYYADELGHPSVPIPPDRVRDPFGINMPGGTQGRDPVRTPMPWDRTLNAGFTVGDPWLPFPENAAELCVTTERDDPESMLSLTRMLLKLRREEPALSIGDWKLIPVTNALAFARRSAGKQFIIVLELESRAAEIDLGSDIVGRIVLSTHRRAQGEMIHGRFALRADEAIIIESVG